jgi:hypothetical protein
MSTRQGHTPSAPAVRHARRIPHTKCRNGPGDRGGVSRELGGGLLPHQQLPGCAGRCLSSATTSGAPRPRREPRWPSAPSRGVRVAWCSVCVTSVGAGTAKGNREKAPGLLTTDPARQARHRRCRQPIPDRTEEPTAWSCSCHKGEPIRRSPEGLAPTRGVALS